MSSLEKPVIKLFNWIVIPHNSGKNVIVDGQRRGYAQNVFWKSSVIIRNLSQTSVLSKNGNVYLLCGPFCSEYAESLGIPNTFNQYFQHGFRHDWKDFILRHYNTLRLQRNNRCLTPIQEAKENNMTKSSKQCTTQYGLRSQCVVNKEDVASQPNTSVASQPNTSPQNLCKSDNLENNETENIKSRLRKRVKNPLQSISNSELTNDKKVKVTRKTRKKTIAAPKKTNQESKHIKNCKVILTKLKKTDCSTHKAPSNVQKVNAEVNITAKPGTVNHKRQLLALYSAINKSYEDDLFHSTPFKNRRLQCVAEEPSNDSFFGNKLPFDTPISHGTPDPGFCRKTPSNTTLTPGHVENLDTLCRPEQKQSWKDLKYIQKLKRRKRLISHSTPVHRTKTSKSGPESSDAFKKLLENNTQINEDDEEENEDEYFSE